MRIEKDIQEHVSILSENEKSGWRKELNYVSWGGDAAKLDIRDWESEYEKAGKGVRLTKREARNLRDALNGLDLDD